MAEVGFCGGDGRGPGVGLGITAGEDDDGCGEGGEEEEGLEEDHLGGGRGCLVMVDGGRRECVWRGDFLYPGRVNSNCA